MKVSMIRAILRLFSSIALSVAVIMAVLDATRSIAVEQIIMTPLGVSWASLSPASLEAIEKTFATNLPHFLWDPLMTGLLLQPGFAVFAVLALLLALAGRRPQTHRQFAL